MAKLAGDGKGRQRVQSQLLKKLKGVSLEAEEAKKEDGVVGEEISPALGDLLDNLKIEKSKPRVKSHGTQQGQGRGWGKAGEEGEGGSWNRKDAENMRCFHCGRITLWPDHPTGLITLEMVRPYMMISS